MSETLLRLKQIIGDKKENIPPMIPISKSSWWSGIKTGRYPKGIKLSDRITVWRASDIHTVIEQAGETKAA